MGKFLKFYILILMWITILFTGFFCVNGAFCLISAPSTIDVFFGIFILFVYAHLFAGGIYATVKSFC